MVKMGYDREILAKLDLIANILAKIYDEGLPLKSEISTNVTIEGIDKLLALFVRNYPPEDAIGIDISPEPIVLNPKERKQLFSYRNPSSVAVILYFGQSIDVATGFDYVEWWIKKEGSPIEPYDPIVGEISSVFDVELAKLAAPIVLNRNEELSVEVYNNNPTDTYNVTCRVKGWRWNL